jgi:pimeloyl-ACP methyl ester carboxylesterase
MSSESRLFRVADALQLHVRLSRCAHPNAPLCFLIHGFGDGAYVWEDVCTALRDTCTTAAIDLRGHGDSQHSRTGVYDLNVSVQDVRSVLADLGPTSLILIGHSFGAEIVLRIAAHSPAALLGTVFVDVAPEINQEAAKRATTLMQETLLPYRTVEEYCSLLMSIRPLLHETAARQLARGALRECADGLHVKLDPAITKYADKEFTTPAEWQALLPKISCPTLVMRGQGSALVSASAVNDMLRMLPRGRLVTIPRAGHAVMSDNSSASSTSIASFVTSLTPSRAPAASLVRA